MCVVEGGSFAILCDFHHGQLETRSALQGDKAADFDFHLTLVHM